MFEDRAYQGLRAMLDLGIDETSSETPISILREHALSLGQANEKLVLGEVRLKRAALEYRLIAPAAQPPIRHVLFRLTRPGDEPYPLRVLEAPGSLAVRVRAGQALLRSHEELEAFLEAVFQEQETRSSVERLVALGRRG